MSSSDLASRIRDVPDFPEEGVVFKDVTPLLADGSSFVRAIDEMARPWLEAGVTAVAAIESRGFIFGGGIAERLACGFVPVRKPGKLPRKTIRQSYELEYGSDALEIHQEDLSHDDLVLVVDDVLATGGTASAAVALVEKLGAKVAGVSTLIELAFLGGRDKLESIPYSAPIRYD